MNTFIALSTQWRSGGAGPTGLDYAAMPGVFRMLSIPRGQWPQLFEDIRVMEYEALDTIQSMKQR